MNRPAVVVLAPDSFKGTLPADEVAAALARGWRSVRPGDEVRLAPLADGGEGTLDAIEAAGGWHRERTVVHDPLGRPVEAAWLRSLGPADGSRGVVEMAEGSGLSRVAPAERDAVRASSGGLGELIVAALDAGVRELLVGIGGSASTDGGRGMLEALGARVDGGRLDLDDLEPRLAALSVRVASDVVNPLLGEHGAAAVYGPQKGATTPAIVATLERRLAAWASAVESATGERVRDLPGAGAAGGVGFALLALRGRVRGFALEPGVELVMEATGFRDRLAGADLVLTGEGRIDGQTAFGKTVAGVARLARELGVRCVAVGGSATPDGRAALEALGAETLALGGGHGTLSEARAAGTEPLERAAAGIAATMGGR
ncbi:MAG: Glycerate kinase [Chloroflexota bacterium]